MKPLTKVLLPVCILMLTLTACDSRVFYAESESIEEKGWLMTDTIYFDVDVADTSKLYNCYIDLRNTTDYLYSNTFFFINTTFPDGGVAYDTLECPLTDYDGQWLGQRTGDLIDNRFFFRKAVIFPMSGTYRFAVTHGMRDTSVVGMQSVGFRIEYAN